MKETYENRAITSSSKRAASKPKKTTKKVKNLRFLDSPTGKYGLAYNAGHIVPVENFKKELVDKMIKEGYAELCD